MEVHQISRRKLLRVLASVTALGILGPILNVAPDFQADAETEKSVGDKNEKFVNQIDICFPPGVSIAKAQEDLRSWADGPRYRQFLEKMKRERRLFDFSINLSQSPMSVRLEFPTLADRDSLIQYIERNRIFDLSKRDALGYSFRESLFKVKV